MGDAIDIQGAVVELIADAIGGAVRVIAGKAQELAKANPGLDMWDALDRAGEWFAGQASQLR